MKLRSVVGQEETNSPNSGEMQGPKCNDCFPIQHPLLRYLVPLVQRHTGGGLSSLWEPLSVLIWFSPPVPLRTRSERAAGWAGQGWPTATSSASHPWVTPRQPHPPRMPTASLGAVKWGMGRTGCFSRRSRAEQRFSAVSAGAWEPNSRWKPIDLRLLSYLSLFEKLLCSQKLTLHLRGPEMEPHPLQSFFNLFFPARNWRMDASVHQEQWRWKPVDSTPWEILFRVLRVSMKKHRQVGPSSPYSSAGTCGSACCLHMVEKSRCVSNSSGQRRCCK